METIQMKIDRFYNAIKNKEAGEADSRYKSWEYCHAIFMRKHSEMAQSKNYELTPGDADLLALHLGFYLASWGMYRGSSFLLQRDYKTHIKVVKEIMQEKYESLWDFVPSEDNIADALDRLFGKDGMSGLNENIKELYGGTTSEEAEEADSQNEETTSQKEGTETLITKILMGTFACVPAFDRFLRAGIANQKRIANDKEIDVSNVQASLAYYARKKSIGPRQLTQSYTRDTCRTLMEFVKEKRACFMDQKQKIEYEKDKSYPPMKRLDMYLWEIGYELSLVEYLKRESVNLEKVKRIKEYCEATNNGGKELKEEIEAYNK